MNPISAQRRDRIGQLQHELETARLNGANATNLENELNRTIAFGIRAELHNTKTLLRMSDPDDEFVAELARQALVAVKKVGKIE